MNAQATNSLSATGVTLAELLGRAGILAEAMPRSASVTITALTDDSRDVRPGACFVAVKGERHDGRRFVGDALRAGAAAVVMDSADEPADRPERTNACIIRVADTRVALARLAAAYFGLSDNRALPGRGPADLTLVGVTGTNGKTTTTWLLRSILQAAGERPAVLGTVEYDLVGRRIAAPLTTPGSLMLCRHLAEARGAGATTAALEVSSHALDQRRTDGLRFAAGVFTNLTGDHLDYHGSFEAYRAAKQRLFEGLDEDAWAVVNTDDPSAEAMIASTRARVCRAAIDNSDADYTALVGESGLGGMHVVWKGPGVERRIALRLVGRFNVCNALLAAATAHCLGVPADAIVCGLESVHGVPGRLQRVEPLGHPFSVFVDYAHTDDALRNVLTTLRPLTPGRLFCVFGCGGDRDRSKRPRMGAVVAELADIAVVTSDNPRSETPLAIIEQILPGLATKDRRVVHVEPDRRQAIALAAAMAEPGDAVLVAGKGHETYQILSDRTISFDDVAVARKALTGLGVKEDVA